MRQRTGLALGVVSLLLFTASAFAGQIYGDYVETRSADVWTGPCTAMGQVNLTGNQATMAWKVRQGEWNGVPLDGLTVMAVAKANATLGDPYGNPYPVKAVLIVDRNATDDQRQALVEFAKTMGGRLLDNVVLVQSEPITMQVGEAENHGSILLEAGEVAVVQTRLLNSKDHFCGNESTFYPPLTELAHAMPAVAVSNEYLGNSLDSVWRLFNQRSAFVGTFSRESGKATAQLTESVR